jgi:hypothetical protein
MLTSLEELERIVTRMTARENRWQVYTRTATRMGIPLEPDQLWLLARIGETAGPRRPSSSSACASGWRSASGCSHSSSEPGCWSKPPTETSI